MAEPREDYGDGTPAWIADDTKIEVDVARIEEFGRAVQAELMAFGTNMKQAIMPLSNYNVPFGGGGLAEGQSFRGINDRNKSAATNMMADVTKGLQAFMSASFAIAQEYADGDAMSKATTDSIYGAFYGDGKKKMISDLMGADGGQKGEQGGPGATEDPKIDQSTDPVSGGDKTDDHKDDGKVVLGEGAGDYTVWEDSEKVKSVETDVASANDGKPIILAPGPTGGSSSSSGTVA